MVQSASRAGILPISNQDQLSSIVYPEASTAWASLSSFQWNLEWAAVARRVLIASWPLLSQSLVTQAALHERKMFGSLIGQWTSGESLPLGVYWLDHSSRLVIMFAYSGQVNGVWEWPGWAPSLLDHAKIAGISWRAQRDLHRLSTQITTRGAPPPTTATLLRSLRRQRSHEFADQIRAATGVYSMNGDRKMLDEIWPSAPTGVGECCGPKLLCWAAHLRIVPLGLAEATMSEKLLSNATLLERCELRLPSSNPMHHSLSFYAPCSHRCRPLFPFLLGEHDFTMP